MIHLGAGTGLNDLSFLILRLDCSEVLLSDDSSLRSSSSSEFSEDVRSSNED